jgi:purine-binding chemotaxis protein CheW
MSPAMQVTGTGWCTFTLGEGLYGVELERMHEVLRPQPLTRVPLAPPAVAGLLNLRGRIVPAVDPRHALGLEPRRSAPGEGGPGALVVVRGAAAAAGAPDLVALLVDEIGDVQRAGRDPAPPGPPPALASAIVPLADRLLVVLDVDRLLERAFARTSGDPS